MAWMRELIVMAVLSLVFAELNPGAAPARRLNDAVQNGGQAGAATGAQTNAAAAENQGPNPTPKLEEKPEQEDEEGSAEENMQRRFPQPVKAGELIGRRVLDENRSTVGRVHNVVRTPEGKIELIIAYGGFLGLGQRLIAVPIATVAAIGVYVAAVDIEREDLDATETWDGSSGKPIPPSEVIKIAVTAR
jgi:sporulation protein YlmC with PRC-barrel domain